MFFLGLVVAFGLGGLWVFYFKMLHDRYTCPTGFVVVTIGVLALTVGGDSFLWLPMVVFGLGILAFGIVGQLWPSSVSG